MTELKRGWQQIGVLEAVALLLVGLTIALAVAGQLDPAALILLLVLAYFGWMARGVLVQAERFRPVEPPNTWAITLVANLVLMALGIGAFGWYLSGGGSMAWVPFLVFMAGMMALRQWRRGQTARLYAWRVPALTLLQKGEYKKLIRVLEDEATAGRGHPDKLAMVALAYIEQNKLETAERLLLRAKQLAPDYASVNGALGSLRRHQARYAEAVEAIRAALAFEDNANSRYYLGLCQYLAGDRADAEHSLRQVIDDPTLIRLGQAYSAYLLGQIAEARGDLGEAQGWYARLAEAGPKAIPALQEEYRRHKQTPYGETLKDDIREMEKLIARRPLEV
jgi:Tfp pilus assembly protein PilF